MPRRKHVRTKPPPQPSPSARATRAGGQGVGGEAGRAARGAWPVWLVSPAFAILLLSLVTLLAYINTWHHGLMFDDGLFVDHARFEGMGPADLGRFFRENLWAASGVDSGLYRPLLLSLIAVQTWVFGDWLMGYHIVSTLLHIIATIFVFALIRDVLAANGKPERVSLCVALFAALVFGVHPIHVEVVNSLFNGSESLVTIGAAGGLWWFLRRRRTRPVVAWLGLGVIYLAALFCRESAVSLPALAVAMLWFTLPDRWTTRLLKCLPAIWLAVPLGLYLVLRSNALAPPAPVPAQGTEVVVEAAAQAAPAPETSVPAVSVDAAAAAPPVPEASDSVAEATGSAPGTDTGAAQTPPGVAESVAEGTVPDMPAAPPLVVEQPLFTVRPMEIWEAHRPREFLPALRLWYQSLAIMVWPHPLQVYYDEPDSALWLAIGVQAALLTMAIIAWLKGRPELFAGLTFFYLAFLPSSRVFGEFSAAPGLADRILYLPSVGLALALAAAIAWLLRRFGVRAAGAAVVLVLFALTPLTWARNADWSSDLRLLEDTYQRLQNKEPILNGLLATHLRGNNFRQAAQLCDVHAYLLKPGKSFGAHCGYAYGRTGRFADAERAYLSAIDASDSKSFAHMNLGMMYAHLGRRAEATNHFERAVKAEGKLFLREYFTALKLLRLYPDDRASVLQAKAHLERALQLQPQHAESRQELDQLNASLN